MQILLEWFHKITSAGTTEVQISSHENFFKHLLQTRRKELKEKVIIKIEEGRRIMGLDMIMRTAAGEPATEKNTGIITLYKMV